MFLGSLEVIQHRVAGVVREPLRVPAVAPGFAHWIACELANSIHDCWPVVKERVTSRHSEWLGCCDAVDVASADGA